MDAREPKALIARWAQVEELEMRAALICERLETMPNDDALRLIDEAYGTCAMGNPEAQLVFLALGWALSDPRIRPRRLLLAAAARAADLDHVAELMAPADPPDEGDSPRRIPDFGLGRPLTLGERKSVARTHDRTLIARVVRDPHPDVIRILLDNPSLTEPDVVRICASRPCDPEVLQTVYHHRRWVVRYRPRNALVRNPSTPLDTALLLAPLLRPAELREAATSSELPAPLRLSCRTLLDRRQRPSEPSL